MCYRVGHFKMDKCILKNVFDALGLSNGESVDMLTPVGEPIRRASHRHSFDYSDPTDMLYSDVGRMWYPKPFSLGRAFMYDDPYSGEEGYLPISMGYPQVGPSYLKDVWMEITLLMVPIILDQPCRAVSHYTQVLGRNL